MKELKEGVDYIVSEEGNCKYGKDEDGKLIDYGVLWSADENCIHEIYSPLGGGIKCRKCTGWFCY